MAKTATKELTTVEKFQQAQAAILAKSDELKQLQGELEELKADYRSLVDELPQEVKQLFLFAAPAHTNGAATKRPRAKSGGFDLEAMRDSILTQLKGKGSMKSGDFDKEGFDEKKFAVVLRDLASEGQIKKAGEKRGTTYSLK